MKNEQLATAKTFSSFQQCQPKKKAKSSLLCNFSWACPSRFLAAESVEEKISSSFALRSCRSSWTFVSPHDASLRPLSHTIHYSKPVEINLRYVTCSHRGRFDLPWHSLSPHLHFQCYIRCWRAMWHVKIAFELFLMLQTSADDSQSLTAFASDIIFLFFIDDICVHLDFVSARPTPVSSLSATCHCCCFCGLNPILHCWLDTFCLLQHKKSHWMSRREEKKKSVEREIWKFRRAKSQRNVCRFCCSLWHFYGHIFQFHSNRVWFTCLP